MKRSDGGFNARRLRPRGPGNWRWRLIGTVAVALALLGLLLLLGGVASLLGHPPGIGDLYQSTQGSAITAVAGLLVLWLGFNLWRRCRRRLRQGNSLNLSPHLMKKHD